MRPRVNADARTYTIYAGLVGIREMIVAVRGAIHENSQPPFANTRSTPLTRLSVILMPVLPAP
jgi:hypothetical protein